MDFSGREGDGGTWLGSNEWQWWKESPVGREEEAMVKSGGEDDCDSGGGGDCWQMVWQRIWAAWIGDGVSRESPLSLEMGMDRLATVEGPQLVMMEVRGTVLFSMVSDMGFPGGRMERRQRKGTRSGREEGGSRGLILGEGRRKAQAAVGRRSEGLRMPMAQAWSMAVGSGIFRWNWGGRGVRRGLQEIMGSPEVLSDRDRRIRERGRD